MLFIPITANAIPQLLDQGVPELAIRQVLIRVASRYTPILQKSAPVDTGALKRSLRVDLLPDDSGVALVSVVFYAGFVEYGTKRKGARLYATNLVPDIIDYMNLLLSELGTFTRSPITANDTGEQSDRSTQQVSQSFFDRIRQNRVGSQELKPLSTLGKNVINRFSAPILVDPSSVSREYVPGESVL